MGNKKAFTLLELLAVIIILGILVVLAVPKVTDIIETAKEKSFENNLLLFEQEAKKYANFNQEYLPLKDGESKIIKLEELLDLKLISQILDPTTNNSCEKGSYVKIAKENNNYKYETFLICDSYLSEKGSLKLYMQEEYIDKAISNYTGTGEKEIEELINKEVIDPITKKKCSLAKITDEKNKVEAKIICDNYISLEYFDLLNGRGHFDIDPDGDGFAYDLSYAGFVANKYIENNTQTITKSSLGIYASISITNLPNLIKDHEYYYTYEAKLKNSTSLYQSTRIWFGTAKVDHSDEDFYNNLDSYTIRNGERKCLDSGTIQFYINMKHYLDPEIDAGAELKVKNLYFLDKSEIFGLGNEPSKEYMDNLITRSK